MSERFVWCEGEVEFGCEICGREVAPGFTLCGVCADLIDRQTEMLLEERHFGGEL
jgi:hypothetical protein